MSAKLFIAAVLLLAGGAAALHEDEVGQRDWNRQHIGIATSAAFQFTQSSKQVFVGSQQGAFGALAIGKPELRWRHVLSPDETVVCWAPHGEMVISVTSKGSIITATAATGDIVQSRHISSFVSSAAAKVHACAATAEKGLTAFITTDAEQTATEVIALTRGDAFASLGKATAAAPIKKASMDAEAGHIYAVLTDGSLAYTATKANALAAVPAVTIAGCSPLTIDPATGAVIVRQKDAEGHSLLTPTGAKAAAELPTCDNEKKRCKYAFADGLPVRVSREDEATIKISHGTAFEATLALAGEWAPTVLAATVHKGKQSSRLYLLVKDCHATLSLIAVTAGTSEAALQWSRLEGMSSPAHIKIADHDMAATADHSDWAGTNHSIFVLGTSGMLYRTFTLPSRAANETSAFVDISIPIARAADLDCLHGKVQYKRMAVDSGSIIVVAHVADDAYMVEVSAATGAVIATSKLPAVDSFLGHMIVNKNRGVFVHKHERDIPTIGTHGIDTTGLAANNTIRGVRVNKRYNADHTWAITFPGKVLAHATAASHLSVFSVEHLRVFANETSKVSEVRRKYPTANLLVVAHAEMSDVEGDGTETSVLVVSFIDMVTGSFLATNRHIDAAGPVHIAVVEHAVVTHFYNTERHKYLVDVSELFEAEDSFVNDASMASPAGVIASFFVKPRTVSSFTMRPPHVASQVLIFPPGAITSLGATISFQGVARKLIVFGTAAGKVYAVDLRAFLFGGQSNMAKPDLPAVTFVPTPSQSIISHKGAVMQSRIVAVGPTSLESSNHIVVAGLDMLYSRVSAGKAWDLLNDDFNKPLLLIICGTLLLATAISRWIASRRRLSLMWS